MKYVLVLPLLTISACTITTGDATESRFATPTASGNFSGFEAGQSNGGSDADGAGNGYAYRAGAASSSNTGFLAVAGMLPGTDVGAEVTTGGSVDYSGTYEYAGVTNIQRNNNVIGDVVATGTAITGGGATTLRADFGAGTLRDVSGGLEVNGTISGADIGGTARVNGTATTTTLDGLIGTNLGVGVFHGSTSSEVISGGFLVVPVP